jgi:hypothetical protein
MSAASASLLPMLSTCCCGLHIGMTVICLISSVLFCCHGIYTCAFYLISLMWYHSVHVIDHYVLEQDEALKKQPHPLYNAIPNSMVVAAYGLSMMMTVVSQMQFLPDVTVAMPLRAALVHISVGVGSLLFVAASIYLEVRPPCAWRSIKHDNVPCRSVHSSGSCISCLWVGKLTRRSSRSGGGLRP